MKNTVTFISIILLLFLLIIPISGANVFVSPSSMYVTMTDTYTEGNTSKKITVTNQNSYDILVNAWMSHPDIIEWMRPNRTLIDNLSWITIEPSELVIPSNSSSYFYIYFAIPDNETKNETYDKHWEVWAALKINPVSENISSSFKQGYLVRVYIDTPEQPTEPEPSPSQPRQIFYDTLIAIIIAIIFTIILFYFRKKRKKQ